MSLDDPRIQPLVAGLLEVYVPGKKISEISSEVLEIATDEAVLVLKIIDGLRPPDVQILSERQVERVSASARNQELLKILELLRTELQNSEERHGHLMPGIRWAIETVATRLAFHTHS